MAQGKCPSHHGMTSGRGYCASLKLSTKANVLTLPPVRFCLKYSDQLQTILPVLGLVAKRQHRRLRQRIDAGGRTEVC